MQPKIGDPLQALGGAIRYATSFDDRTREIAILVVADVWDSAFERHAHEPIGRASGLTEAELAAIRLGPDGVEHLVKLPAAKAGIYHIYCQLHPAHRTATLLVVDQAK